MYIFVYFLYFCSWRDTEALEWVLNFVKFLSPIFRQIWWSFTLIKTYFRSTPSPACLKIIIAALQKMIEFLNCWFYTTHEKEAVTPKFSTMSLFCKLIQFASSRDKFDAENVLRNCLQDPKMCIQLVLMSTLLQNIFSKMATKILQ